MEELKASQFTEITNKIIQLGIIMLELETYPNLQLTVIKLLKESIETKALKEGNKEIKKQDKT